nr:MAG TPA: hypothetical protein [Caudoviricetes sp.]
MAGTLSSRQPLKLLVRSPRPGFPRASTTLSSGARSLACPPRPLSTALSLLSGAGASPAKWPCPSPRSVPSLASSSVCPRPTTRPRTPTLTARSVSAAPMLSSALTRPPLRATR